MLCLILAISFAACGGKNDSVDLTGTWTDTYQDGTECTMLINADGTGTLKSEYGEEEFKWQAGTCMLYSEKEDFCMNSSEGHREFEITIDGDTTQLTMGEFYQFTKDK